jgi:hypothetical protein
MPRPTTDFTIDSAPGADAIALVNTLARHHGDPLFAIYASGDDLPLEVGEAGQRTVSEYGRTIYRWDGGVRLLRCTERMLSFEAEPGLVTHLPLVGPAAHNDVGVSELVLTLLSPTIDT